MLEEVSIRRRKVLRLERDSWSMVKSLSVRQATTEYAPSPPPRPQPLHPFTCELIACACLVPVEAQLVNERSDGVAIRSLRPDQIFKVLPVHPVR